MVKNTDSFYRLVGYVCIIISVLCFIKWGLSLFRGRAYIEITPTYIQIDNFEKLLWTDIVGVRSLHVKNGTTDAKPCWLIDVKDVSKYKLTFLQKANLAVYSSPFWITLVALSKKDREEIKRILKERIPQNDLD